MFGYIYKTTDVNGKIYVGQHHGDFDEEYFGSGTIISRIVKKRKEKLIVECLEECHDQEDLNEREKFWIKKLNSTDEKIGYNIQGGGQGYDCSNGGSFLGKRHTEEAKQKNREAHLGKKASEETRLKISSKLKGRSNPNKGKHFSKESSIKKSISLKGKKKSKEHAQHIGDSRRGIAIKEETKIKISQTLKSKNNIGKTKWIYNPQEGVSKKLTVEEANFILDNESGWYPGRIKTWKNQYEKRSNQFK